MSLSDAEQNALIARFQQGDTTVFDELYACIKQGVYGYIRGVLTRNDDEAQEINQDTWLYFLNTGIRRYDTKTGRLLPFVKKSARWMALQYYYKHGRRGEVKLLLSQLRVRDPNINTDPELADIQEYARDRPQPSAEATAPGAEYERLQAEVYDELFQLTFTHGTSPPHHLVAMGFRLWPVWPPRRIVAELSDCALTALVGKLEAGLVHAVTYLSEERLRAHLRALQQRMEQSVHAICVQLQLDLLDPQHDPPRWCVSVALYHGSGVGLTDALDAQNRSAIVSTLQQYCVGTTTFRHYYTAQKPEDDIRLWRDAVKRQVLKAIRQQGKGHLFDQLQHAAAQK